MSIQAIRYTLPESDESFDAVLKSVLIDMLSVMLRDSELENRRLALTTLNSAAHNKPDLIIPNLGSLLPQVLKESHINQALIREVTMGPFKHKIDDGLEVRKVRFSLEHLIFNTDYLDRAHTRPSTLSWKPHSPASTSSNSTTASSPALRTSTTSAPSATSCSPSSSS